LTKIGLVYISEDFFTNSSGHPACPSTDLLNVVRLFVNDKNTSAKKVVLKKDVLKKVVLKKYKYI
jgi:hypothetical protein